MVIRRFDVFLTNLDPTIGAEIQKTRPCVVISPNEMNATIQTIIIAPMTTVSRSYPTRVACAFDGRDAFVVLDQIRTVDRHRLLRKLGQLDLASQKRVLDVLAELFAE